ncbi:MAG: hypothetical protein HQM06_14925 [Magnetococcales bacterium]|nr:hypothetical protein [Magnetococcales bacterium]
MAESLHIYTPTRCHAQRTHGKVLCHGQEQCIVIVTPEGEQAWNDAFGHALPDAQSKAFRMLERLADVRTFFNTEKFVNEGDGIWAIKPVSKIRIYGWYCTKRRGDFVIGHAAFKNQQKMNPEDRYRVQSIRNLYESKEYPR